jgi:hypothetical protein
LRTVYRRVVEPRFSAAGQVTPNVRFRAPADEGTIPTGDNTDLWGLSLNVLGVGDIEQADIIAGHNFSGGTARMKGKTTTSDGVLITPQNPNARL